VDYLESLFLPRTVKLHYYNLYIESLYLETLVAAFDFGGEFVAEEIHLYFQDLFIQDTGEVPQRWESSIYQGISGLWNSKVNLLDGRIKFMREFDSIMKYTDLVEMKHSLLYDTNPRASL
jgi:hypothetical protein